MFATATFRTDSEAATLKLGATIGGLLRGGDTVLLIGDLGTGKTRLAKGIISAAAGVSIDDVVSPSFSLLNRFEGPFPVYHADLYRLEPHQVRDIGLDEALEENGALIVEWAERLVEIDADALKIYLSDGDEEDSRVIVLEWSQEGRWRQRLRNLPTRTEEFL